MLSPQREINYAAKWRNCQIVCGVHAYRVSWILRCLLLPLLALLKLHNQTPYLVFSWWGARETIWNRTDGNKPDVTESFITIIPLAVPTHPQVIPWILGHLLGTAFEVWLRPELDRSWFSGHSEVIGRTTAPWLPRTRETLSLGSSRLVGRVKPSLFISTHYFHWNRKSSE